MAKFNSNPEDVRNLSNEIRNLYNEAEEKSEEILACISELPSGWEGEASITYQNQFTALNVLITNAIEGFESICTSLDNVALSLEEGEKGTWQE